MQQNDPVLAQSRDNSLLNTEPAVVRGVVVGVVGAVGAVLVLMGYISEEERQQLIDSSGQLVVAVVVFIPLVQALVQAIWTRSGVWSGKTAATIAVVNARQPAGSEPTLLSPP